MQNNIEGFHELVNQGRIGYIAIDGLDASGKGTIAYKIAEKINSFGQNVVLIDYPQYMLPWGNMIKTLLKSSAEKTLSLEERMAVYALNRLETLDTLIQEILEVNNGNKITVIFDRCHTSNILTLAYYLDKKYVGWSQDKIKNQIDTEKVEILKLFNKILEIDRFFIEYLHLQNLKICIPQIDPKIAIQRLKNDETRDGADTYERHPVQAIADVLYKTAAQYPDLNIFILPQGNNSPEVIAEMIIDSYKVEKVIPKNSVLLKRVEIKEPKFSKEVQQELNIFWERYPNLKALKP